MMKRCRELCLAVINFHSVFSKDMRDPTNKDKWATQHDALKMLDPPYVYHVVRIGQVLDENEAKPTLSSYKTTKRLFATRFKLHWIIPSIDSYVSVPHRWLDKANDS